LRLNPDKCRFCVDRLKYLGHIVDQDGIKIDPKKARAIADWPESRIVKQIRQFLSVAFWYRRYTLALIKKNAR